MRTVAPDRAVSLDAAGHVRVVGDADRLRQVADNLLANAAKHTPAGTAVDVRVFAEGADAVLEVRDHGPGVAPEDRARIFEPFYRSDSSRTRATGGAGLGLSIVSAIVVAHGGDVGVGAPADGGAVFRVRLPRTPRPDAPGTVPSAPGAELASR